MSSTTDAGWVRALTSLQVRAMAQLESALAPTSCSVEQWWVLSYLAAHPGRPMNEVGAHALLPAPRLTKVVDRMVDDNLVYRRADPADRRRSLLYPSVRGGELAARVRPVVEAAEAAVAEVVGRELAALVPAPHRGGRSVPALP